MSLADIAWHELDLAINDRQRADAPEKLKGVLAFGEPVVLDCFALARAAKEDPDPGMKLLSDEHRFNYLRLALTIRPKENLVVRFVSLDLTLDGDALCWSMEPMKVEQEIKAKAEVSFSTKFKIKMAEFGGGEKASQEYVVYQPVIEAFNLQRSDPGWELHAQTGKQLSGIQLFHMVVQAPKARECRARVSLRADIMGHGFLWNYTARRSDQREHVASFSISN
jgi:hypothetical protein